MIIEAESGARAVELRSARKPDCLTLNQDLPDLSGLEALKKLVAEERAPACAVVVLVGAGDSRA
jgi:CheY-like chemotaxis protein